MTKQEWVAAAGILANFYPHNFKVSDSNQMRLWFMGLADLPGDRVEAAVWHMCRTKEAFPSLADIRKLAEVQREDPTEAWLEACRYASEWGSGPVMRNGKLAEPPGIQTPAIAQAVRAMGGIEAIKARTMDDEPAMRAHFFRAYEAALSKVRRSETFEAFGVNEKPALQAPRGAVKISELMPPKSGEEV